MREQQRKEYSLTLDDMLLGLAIFITHFMADKA